MILVNRHFRFGYPRDHNIMPLICFCPYSRMMRAVTPVRGAPFMKGMLVGLMMFFPGFIVARELVLKTNVFRLLVFARRSLIAL